MQPFREVSRLDNNFPIDSTPAVGTGEHNNQAAQSSSLHNTLPVATPPVQIAASTNLASMDEFKRRMAAIRAEINGSQRQSTQPSRPQSSAPMGNPVASSFPAGRLIRQDLGVTPQPVVRPSLPSGGSLSMAGRANPSSINIDHIFRCARVVNDNSRALKDLYQIFQSGDYPHQFKFVSIRRSENNELAPVPGSSAHFLYESSNDLPISGNSVTVHTMYSAAMTLFGIPEGESVDVPLPVLNKESMELRIPFSEQDLSILKKIIEGLRKVAIVIKNLNDSDRETLFTKKGNSERKFLNFTSPSFKSSQTSEEGTSADLRHDSSALSAVLKYLHNMYLRAMNFTSKQGFPLKVLTQEKFESLVVVGFFLWMKEFGINSESVKDLTETIGQWSYYLANETMKEQEGMITTEHGKALFKRHMQFMQILHLSLLPSISVGTDNDKVVRGVYLDLREILNHPSRVCTSLLDPKKKYEKYLLTYQYLNSIICLINHGRVRTSIQVDLCKKNFLEVLYPKTAGTPTFDVGKKDIEPPIQQAASSSSENISKPSESESAPAATESIFTHMIDAFKTISPERKEKIVEAYQSFHSVLDDLFASNQEKYKLFKEFVTQSGRGYWKIPLICNRHSQVRDPDAIHALQKEIISGVAKTFDRKYGKSNSAESKIALQIAAFSFLKQLNFVLPETLPPSHNDKSKYINQFIPFIQDQETRTILKALLDLAIGHEKETSQESHQDCIPIDNASIKKAMATALFYLKMNQIEKEPLLAFEEAAQARETLHGVMLIDGDSHSLNLKGHGVRIEFNAQGAITAFLRDADRAESQEHHAYSSTEYSLDQIKELRTQIQDKKAICNGLPIQFVIEPVKMMLPYERGSYQKGASTSRVLSEASSHASHSRASGQAPSWDLTQHRAMKTSQPFASEEISKSKKKAAAVVSTGQQRRASSSSSSAVEESSSYEQVAGGSDQKSIAGSGSLVNLFDNKKSSIADFTQLLEQLTDEFLTGCEKRLMKRQGIANTRLITYPIVMNLPSNTLHKAQESASKFFPFYRIAKPYQQTALKAMNVYQSLDISLIVAWGVGTGKTHLMIGEIVQHMATSKSGAYLICSPLSLIEQTEESFKKHFHMNRQQLVRDILSVINDGAITLDSAERLVRALLIEFKNPSPELQHSAVTWFKKIAENIHQTDVQSFNEKLNALLNGYAKLGHILHPEMNNLDDCFRCDKFPPSSDWVEALFQKLAGCTNSSNRAVRFIGEVISFISTYATINHAAPFVSVQMKLTALENLQKIDTDKLIVATNNKRDVQAGVTKISSDSGYTLVITTPSVIQDIKDDINKISWSNIYFDEAHTVAANSKNTGYKQLFEVVRPAIQNKATVRLLTATPFQGKISKLFDLLNFAFPGGNFSSDAENTLKKSLKDAIKAYSSLGKEHNDKNAQSNQAHLEHIIEAYAHFQVFKQVLDCLNMRITKEDSRVKHEWGNKVLNKTFQQHQFTLSQLQNELINTLSSDTSNNNFFKVDSALDRILVHPCLHELRSSESDEKEKKKAVQQNNKLFNKIAAFNDTQFQEFIAQSGFIDSYLKNTDTLVAQSKRWLTFVDQKIVAEFLSAILQRKHRENLKIFVFDGSLNKDQRNSVVDHFKRHSGAACLIMTIQAGGVGLNIPGVDVHLIAKPWEPSHEEQALGRSDRAGHEGTIEINRYFNKELEDRYLKIIKIKQFWDTFFFGKNTLVQNFHTFLSIMQEQSENSDTAKAEIDKLLPQNFDATLQKWVDQATPSNLHMLQKMHAIAFEERAFIIHEEPQEVVESQKEVSHTSSQCQEQNKFLQSISTATCSLNIQKPQQASSSRELRPVPPSIRLPSAINVLGAFKGEASAPQKNTPTIRAEPKLLQQGSSKIDIPVQKAAQSSLSLAAAVIPPKIPFHPASGSTSGVSQPKKHPVPYSAAPAQSAEQVKKAPTSNEADRASLSLAAAPIPPKTLLQTASGSTSGIFQPKKNPVPYYIAPAQSAEQVKKAPAQALPQCVAIESSETNGLFYAVALDNEEDALKTSYVDIQARITQNNDFSHLIRSLKNDQAKFCGSGQTILEKGIQNNFKYQSIEQCKKEGVQVIIYECDGDKTPLNVVLAAEHRVANPKGTIRILRYTQNNTIRYAALFRK